MTNVRNKNTNIEYMKTIVCADVVELSVPNEYAQPKLPTLSGVCLSGCSYNW